MMGSGTTLVECRLLGRNAVGVDVNKESVMISRDRLAFELETVATPVCSRTFLGDARFLDKISDESVDLVAAHPPYGSIIRYGSTSLPGDLSALPSFESYLEGMLLVAMECFRVIRRGGHCAVLIGDTRRHGHVVLISVGALRLFLAAGFVVREDLVKVQHNVASERGLWGGTIRGFYKLAHERLFVFRKPEGPREVEHLELSSDRMVRLVDSVASHVSSMSAR